MIGDAVVKGGRYDNRFGNSARMPQLSVSSSSLTTLLEALSRQKVNIDIPASGKTVYYRAGDEADYLAKLSEVITLRKEGIPTVLSPEITENEEADQ